MNESEKREVEEDFWKFMRDSICFTVRRDLARYTS